MSKTTPTGFVLYRGPSEIDSNPIVVIATLETANRKTGHMIQTWILRDDISPTDAIRTGKDESVCGSCPLRGYIEKLAEKNAYGNDTANRNRSCYVSVHQAPLGIWKAYKRGSYPDYAPRKHAKHFRGRKLRLGSYGDPVAAPYRVWTPLIALSSGYTGYTHQWREGRFWRFRRYLMASTETLQDSRIAQSRGWRTFRTLTDVSDLAHKEILCPASDEAGKRRQCETCLACNGSKTNPNRVSIAIVAHGSKATLSSYRKLAI